MIETKEMTQMDRCEANLKAIEKNHKREMKKLELAQAVVLSDRIEHANGAVTYTALSSDGVTTYTVTYLSGKSTGCTCISHQPCKHRLAVELREAFLVEWNAEDEEVTCFDIEPYTEARYDDDVTRWVQKDGELVQQTYVSTDAGFGWIDMPVDVEVLGSEFAQDLEAHVTDSIASGEFAYPSEGWAVLTKEQRREAYRNMYPGDYYDVA